MSAALAEVEGQGFAMHPKLGKPLLLPFGKQQYYIPAAAVVSYAKKSNPVPSGEELGKALQTKAPEKWMQFCNPDMLMCIKGSEGTSVYTTFSVEGHPEEERFLRHVSGQIAEKNFPMWTKEVSKQVALGSLPAPEKRSSSAKARYDVLNWKKEKDCPSRAQLHPEINQWTAVAKDGSPLVKSCKVDPETKKRPKGTGDKRVAGDKRKHCDDEDDVMFDVEDDIEFKRGVRVGPKGSYTILERPDKVIIIQHKLRGDAGRDAAVEEDAEEDEADI